MSALDRHRIQQDLCVRKERRETGGGESSRVGCRVATVMVAGPVGVLGSSFGRSTLKVDQKPGFEASRLQLNRIRESTGIAGANRGRLRSLIRSLIRSRIRARIH